MTARINPNSSFATEDRRQDRWNSFATLRVDLLEYAQELRNIRTAIRGCAPNDQDACMATTLEVESQCCLDRLDSFIRDEVWGDPVVYLIWRVEFLGESVWKLKAEVTARKAA